MKNETSRKRNQQGAFWNNMDKELLEKQHQEIQDVKALESTVASRMSSSRMFLSMLLYDD